MRLKAMGVAEVFTPKDFGLNDIMVRFVEVIRASRGLDADAAAAIRSRRTTGPRSAHG